MNRLLAVIAALAAGAVSLPAAAQSANDFARDAIRGDNSEIIAGNYAARHASSAELRQFAQTLVKDATAARAQMLKAAPSIKEFPAEGPKASGQTEQDKLAKLSGRAYDEAYLDYTIKDHQHVVADFEHMAQSRKQEQINQIAAEQLPTLRQQLKTAQDLKARLASQASH
ncbi:MAG TPA: DUF4142 domain-containing protein [Reyranella sp.]|jgi:putative membrane protein|nr:DUF4142 domain-containing protein [Reyranella sp.]